MRIEGKDQYSWHPFARALCSPDFKWSGGPIWYSDGRNIAVTRWHKPQTRANKFLSHWKRTAAAYRRDGRPDFRDLAPFRVGCGIKWDACFLPPFLPAHHSLSPFKCQAFSPFSIKELGEWEIRRGSPDKECRSVVNCNTSLFWEWIHNGTDAAAKTNARGFEQCTCTSLAQVSCFQKHF